MTRSSSIRLPFSAAKRHKKVATAEGRGEHLSRKNWFCANGNHGLQPWLYSDAAPRLLSSHPEFLEIGSSEGGFAPFRTTPSAPIRDGTILDHISKIAFSDAIPVCFVDPAWRKGLIA